MVPNPSRPFDVVIAGAGLAGASLALRLARQGASVALLDPAVFPRDKLCGEFLSPECWGVLDRLGLADDIARSGYQPIRRVRLTTPRGRVIEANLAGPDGLPGIGLSRSTLDDRIVRAAREAGVALFDSARVGGPIVRGDRVIGLRARHATLGPVEVYGTLVIAADGRHSALVRQTGATRALSRFRPRLIGLKRHLVSADGEAAEPPGTVGLHLLPGGYGGTCQVEGGLTNLCALLPESALRPHRGDLERAADAAFGLNPALGRLWTSARPMGHWKAVAGVRVEASRPRRTGILYAGDCQGTIDPLGGQGMTMALLGAELLEPFAVEAIRRGGADAILQRSYHTAWRRRFDRRVRLCRLFHHLLVNPGLIDLGSTLRMAAPRLLTAAYGWSRDTGASSLACAGRH